MKLSCRLAGYGPFFWFMILLVLAWTQVTGHWCMAFVYAGFRPVVLGKAWALRLNLPFVYLFVVMQVGSRFDRLGFF